MPGSSDFRCLVVIPARYASTRFPGKALHPIAGRPLVQHVWERCKMARQACAVIIATDDERIGAAAKNFGAEWVMTRSDHPSGTDRLAEVAASREDITHLINVQGDEPLVDAALIDQFAEALRDDPALSMITAASPLLSAEEIENPNVVKVVLNSSSEALYFSRSRIPFPRNEPTVPCYRHVGIYGYSREFLLRFVQWPPSPLEKTEALEQLRALENGARIRVVITTDDTPGVDTIQQAEAVERLILERGGDSNRTKGAQASGPWQ
ncbi:MAG: 3-deoxy-manno-octulosonate cytidylyltransferase [Verrucomicrobiales bacterium]